MEKRRQKIPPDVSVYLRYLFQDLHLKGKALLDRFPQYSKASIYRHAKKPIGETPEDKRHKNIGRPSLLSERDKRTIIREIPRIKADHGSYTVKRVLLETGMQDKVSRRTGGRFLNKQGLHFLHTRKKGVMTRQDMRKRVRFARKVNRVNPTIWTEGISFYLDGVGFVHKTNPRDEAISPRGMAYRRKCEGLDHGHTSKGKKEGVNGRVAKYIVCISYSKGVICCEPYEKMTGAYFKSFIEDHFDGIFAKSNAPHVRRFLQDGDPSQNSQVCRLALDEMGITMFPIPPRSPDVNPIENLFNNVKDTLAKDAIRLNIVKETYEEFCDRVEDTLINYDKKLIDDTILSMNKRMGLIIKGQGKRLKY